MSCTKVTHSLPPSSKTALGAPPQCTLITSPSCACRLSQFCACTAMLPQLHSRAKKRHRTLVENLDLECIRQIRIVSTAGPWVRYIGNVVGEVIHTKAHCQTIAKVIGRLETYACIGVLRVIYAIFPVAVIVATKTVAGVLQVQPDVPLWTNVISKQEVAAPFGHARVNIALNAGVDIVPDDLRTRVDSVEAHAQVIHQQFVQVGDEFDTGCVDLIHRDEGAHGQAAGQNLGLRFHHVRSEEHTSELQSRENLVCRRLLENKK